MFSMAFFFFNLNYISLRCDFSKCQEKQFRLTSNCETITRAARHLTSAQTAIKYSSWFKKSEQGVTTYEADFHLAMQLSAQEIRSPPSLDLF